MKKLTFVLLFAASALMVNAQTKPQTTLSSAAKKEHACKPGDACCKKGAKAGKACCASKAKTASAAKPAAAAVKKSK